MPIIYSWLFFALLIIQPTPSAAESIEHTTCASISELAETVMEARMNGISMKDSMAINENHENELLKDILRGLIIEAYNTPLYYTEEAKENQKREFSNAAYLSCIKALTKPKE